jgi:hypothetical protein
MDSEDKTDLQLIYQQAWNQYNTYYQSYSIYNSKFNLAGAVSSVFILVLITSVQAWSKLFYIPILPLLMPFILTLINLNYQKIKIPWFGKDDLIGQLKQGEEIFFQKQLDDIFVAAESLFEYKQFARKWMSISVFSIVISGIISIGIAGYVILFPVLCNICPKT